MRQTVSSCAGIGVLLVALSIAVLPGLAKGQAPPVFPGTAGQAESPPAPGDQPLGATKPEGQSQLPGQATQSPTPPPTGSAVQPQDPFAGSPLLQMFERQPDASAPLRQLRFAPSPSEPVPFNVNLFLTAEEEFTDNANQTKNNRQSEFRTRIVPGISARADRPWANFSLSYAPEVFIPDNSIGNTELNQSLSLRAALWPSGRFQFNVADDFIDTNNWQDLQDPGAQRSATNNFLQNVVTAEAAYVLAHLRTGLAYTNIFNQEDRGFTDTRITHIIRPNVLYTDPRFSVSGAYTLTRGDENSSLSIPYWNNKGEGRFLYVFTPTITAGPEGYYEYQEPDIGRHFSLGRGRATAIIGFGAGGTVELGAGADVFAFEGSSTEIKPSFLFSYTKSFMAFSVTARYEHGYVNRYSQLDNSGVTLTRSAGVFVTSSFIRNLTATLGLRYEENEQATTTFQGGLAGTKDTTYSVDVYLRYLLIRSLFLTAGYTGTFRTSTQESDEFNENLVRIGMTYQYNLF
jgi:hypothetical protein